MFMWMIKRDLLLAMRRQSDVLTTLFFFIIVVSLFPLSVGPEMNMPVSYTHLTLPTNREV